jgi:hypothetical protein
VGIDGGHALGAHGVDDSVSELLTTELRQMLSAYLDGRQNKAFVSEIEGLVIEGFQDEAWFDEVSEDLALFLPGGGTYSLDEEALAVTLRTLLKRLGDAGGGGAASCTEQPNAEHGCSAGSFNDSVINCADDSGEASICGG